MSSKCKQVLLHSGSRPKPSKGNLPSFDQSQNNFQFVSKIQHYNVCKSFGNKQVVYLLLNHFRRMFIFPMNKVLLYKKAKVLKNLLEQIKTLDTIVYYCTSQFIRISYYSQYEKTKIHIRDIHYFKADLYIYVRTRQDMRYIEIL